MFSSDFAKNTFILFVILAIWLIFAAVGLRGITVNKSIKEIRQETGLSLLTFFVFTLGLLGFIAFLA